MHRHLYPLRYVYDPSLGRRIGLRRPLTRIIHFETLGIHIAISPLGCPYSVISRSMSFSPTVRVTFSSLSYVRLRISIFLEKKLEEENCFYSYNYFLPIFSATQNYKVYVQLRTSLWCTASSRIFVTCHHELLVIRILSQFPTTSVSRNLRICFFFTGVNFYIGNLCTWISMGGITIALQICHLTEIGWLTPILFFIIRKTQECFMSLHMYSLMYCVTYAFLLRIYASILCGLVHLPA